ncbi:hypothetical protein CRI77_14465 [Mycolicibacterium duvalii]|uniref:Uncharacterized protein n=1 Tax=Mycolicibacterium duvalii TaxID=39688 RepID=A0A7I7K600_9MYCO|nr:hypothetical protein CRI77_14465 [Mycolicibacterium duvalii]BBX19525.1 hypothetical protein MDUV_43850 [Mycolicibacterium duvalii]
MVVFAFWTVLVAGGWAPQATAPATEHGHHAVAPAPAGAATSLSVDHPHVSPDDRYFAADAMAEAVVPRAGLALIAFALVAVLAVPLLWRQAAVATERGPPRRTPASSGGRALLCLLCIARR